MGPMLKQTAAAFRQRLQIGLGVAGTPGRKDHVMRALNRIHAVDLDEANLANQARETIDPAARIRSG